MDRPIRILIVEDLPTDAELAEWEIRKAIGPCEFRRVETRQDYVAALGTFQPDLIVSDYRLPYFDGLAALKLALERAPLTPVLIWTGSLNEDIAVECMKAGAVNYVIKEHIKRLGPAVIHALEEKRVRQERLRAEQALRESEERFRSLYENTTIGLYRTTPDGRILMANPAAVRMLGYHSFDELAQRDLEKGGFAPSYLRGEFRQQLESTGVVIGLESAWIRQDGTTIFVRESARAIRDEQGQIQYYDGSFEDITERKQAEEALRRYADENARLLEAERQHRELAETLREVGATLASTLDASIVLDRLLEQVGRVVPHDVANVMIIEGQNVRIVRSRGYEEFGIDISAAYTPHPFANVPNLVTMAETGQPMIISDVSADLSWIRRSEVTWRRSYVGVPIQARGKPIGFLNVSHSTPGYYTSEHAERLRAFADQAAIALENARLFATEQQRAAALARALEQQRELERLQREFIQNVSHELRTPLALIRGHAEVLEVGWLGELPPEQKGSVSIISRRAQMLSKLVDDIVGILEVERRESKHEPVDLMLLVQTLLADFRPAADQAGLALHAEIAPDVPALFGDSIALRRMLDNLVGNAMKFTSSGGRITIRLSCSEQAVQVQVADTGIGIPGDQLDRIFERFYQVDGSTTRKYGGVGLGLALVKSIVEAHGGQITVTSQVGVGTTFTVVLPIKPGDSA
jgi:PAS domain S-box-containing protein